jgi:hypothetical protein
MINSMKWNENASFECVVNGMILWWSYGALCDALDCDCALKFVQ